MRGSVSVCRRIPAGAVLAAVLALSGVARADTINVPLSGERTSGPGEWLAAAVIAEFNMGLAGPQAANEDAGFQPLRQARLSIGTRRGAGLLWGPLWGGGLSGRPDAATTPPPSRAEGLAQAERPPHHNGAASLVPSSATPEPGTMLLVGVALLLGARIAGRFASRR